MHFAQIARFRISLLLLCYERIIVANYSHSPLLFHSFCHGSKTVLTLEERLIQRRQRCSTACTSMAAFWALRLQRFQ